MGLEVIPIGGFKEIGRNSVAIRADDEVVVLDLGLLMDRYIEYTREERESVEIKGEKLMEIDAAPNINIIRDLKDQVEGICITHAHLDHAGAVPFLANQLDADIHCTPFTRNLIEAMCEDDNKQLNNDLKAHDVNSTFQISDKLEIEFIHATHSTPQTVMIAVHTPYGTVLYANDFKLDNAPTLGPRTNVQRLEQMDVECLIMDSLYADEPIKTPSESIAKEMLKDVLLGTSSQGKAVIATTFASHIARLKSMIEIGKMMNRKVIFLGRSLEKYVRCAEREDIVNFTDEIEIIKYGSQIKDWLSNLENPEDYLMVVTGHQGEPNSTLGKMVYGDEFHFDFEDHVVFSARIIPVEINEVNREKMESQLKENNVRIFRDIHVSGHAAKEDHRELIHMVNPDHIIPAHGDLKKSQAQKDLALEIGYNEDKVHVVGNGERIPLS